MRTVGPIIGLLLMGAVAAPLQASTIDTTTAGFSGSVVPFGEPNTATYGQTFTAPIDSTLTSFTFWLDDEPIWPDAVDFAAYVMAWDGSKATGPILYQSAGQTTTNNAGAGGYEQLTFATGGVSLTPGAQYVAFLSASNFFDGLWGLASMATGATPYAGGAWVWYNNGDNFGLLTTNSWTNTGFGGTDMAFRAEFAAAPEPASLALLGLGFAGLAARRRHPRA